MKVWCQKYVKHYSTTSKIRLNTPFWGGLSLQVFHNCCTSKDIEFCWDDLPKREAKIIWIIWYLPSGNLLHSYWTWQFIADIAIKHCIFPYFSMISYVNVYQRVHVFKRSGVIKRGWLESPLFMLSSYTPPVRWFPSHVTSQAYPIPPVAWTLSAKGCSIPEKTVRFKKIYHTPTYPN